MAGERRRGGEPNAPDLLGDVFGQFDQSVQAELGQAVTDAEEVATTRKQKRDAVSQAYEGFENFKSGSRSGIEDIESLLQWVEQGIQESGGVVAKSEDELDETLSGEEDLDEPKAIPEVVRTNLDRLKQIEAEYNRRRELVKNDPARLQALEQTVFTNQGRQKLVDQTVRILQELGQEIFGRLELSTNEEYRAAYRQTTAAKEVLAAYPDLETAYEAAPDTLPNAREYFGRQMYDQFLLMRGFEQIRPHWVGGASGRSNDGYYDVESERFSDQEIAGKYADERRKCIRGAARYVTDISVSRIEKNVLGDLTASQKKAFFDSQVRFNNYQSSIEGGPGDFNQEQMRNLWLEMKRNVVLNAVLAKKSQRDSSFDDKLQRSLYEYVLVLGRKAKVSSSGSVVRNDQRQDLGERVPKNLYGSEMSDIFAVMNEHDPDLFVQMMALLKVSGYNFRRRDRQNDGFQTDLSSNLLYTGEVFLTEDLIPYRKEKQAQDTRSIKAAIERLTDPKNVKEQEKGGKILTAEQGAQVARDLQNRLIEALSGRKKLEQTAAGFVDKENNLNAEIARLTKELAALRSQSAGLQTEVTSLTRQVDEVKRKAAADVRLAEHNTTLAIERGDSRVAVIKGQLERIVAGARSGILGGSARVDASHIQAIIDQLA